MPFALVASLPVHAAGPPLITDDPGTPGDGRWEINLPITLEQTRSQRLFEAPLFDINYGLGERTQESYLRSVRKFAQWLKRAPDQASDDNLRR